ncbi:hypothetical protein HYDPIDRAFT_100761, partial [Hydnomerulius pinastri MD-312]
PDGKRMVSWSNDQSIRIWEAEEDQVTCVAIAEEVNCVVAFPDGRRFVTVDGEGKLKVLDTEMREIIHEWNGDSHTIWHVTVSPDGTLIATASTSDVGTIMKIWEAESGRLVTHPFETGGAVMSVAFSPDGKKIATGDFLGNIAIFDVEIGSLILGPTTAHKSFVYCIVWSLDGSELFSASTDTIIRKWDTESGLAIGEPLEGHTGWVSLLAISPDGKRLCSASLDKTMRFWDTESGQALGDPLELEEEVKAMTFSPNGEFIASAGWEEKLSLWRVPWWDGDLGQVSV